MTNPKPSPGCRLSSTSTDFACPLASFAAMPCVPTSPPPPLAGGTPARSSIPSKSRGSRVSVTGTESRKLVLWMRAEAGGPLDVWIGGAPKEQEQDQSKVKEFACVRSCTLMSPDVLYLGAFPGLAGVSPVDSLGPSQPG